MANKCHGCASADWNVPEEVTSKWSCVDCKGRKMFIKGYVNPRTPVTLFPARVTEAKQETEGE